MNISSDVFWNEDGWCLWCLFYVQLYFSCTSIPLTITTDGKYSLSPRDECPSFLLHGGGVLVDLVQRENLRKEKRTNNSNYLNIISLS
jgi:hypothetical protein